MWYKIKQGRHRAYPLSLGIHTGKTSESYEVIFDDSCRYTLEGTDKEDWNKLVGWSYGILPWRNQVTFTGARSIGDTEIFEWTPAHHNNSIRIGWRAYPEYPWCIQLCAYMYENGERFIYEFGHSFDVGIKYTINIENNCCEGTKITVNNEDVCHAYVNLSSKYKAAWGYNLGLYFGGRNDKTGKDNVAPHNMKVWIRKLN